jgi:tripartite ATP-independent transporter DctM subunit
VPVFVFMAALLERSGLTSDLYDAVRVWVGRMPGGAAVVTTIFAIIIGAIIGVAGGEMVLLGLVALPQLLRLGYDRQLSLGLVCATGALGSMIPPALTLVFFGLAAGVSVGDLFTASFVPGLMLAGLYIAYVVGRCIVNPALGPPPPASELGLSVREKLAATKKVALPLAVLFGTLGSIYLGFASVTESAAVGAFGTILAVAWRRELTVAILKGALVQTMSACGIVLWLVLGTNALIGIYTVMGGIEFARTMLASLPFPPFVIILVMVAIFLGFFIDWIAILLLTVPIFLPTVLALGYDPIWFGTIFNLAIQVGYLTPPFAPAAFYLKSVAPPDVTIEEIYGSLWPFIGLQLVALALTLVFPEIALWLPRVL